VAKGGGGVCWLGLLLLQLLGLEGEGGRRRRRISSREGGAISEERMKYQGGTFWRRRREDRVWVGCVARSLPRVRSRMAKKKGKS